MAHRKCTICGNDVVLVPSAEQRAKKDSTGRMKAQDFLDLFPTHAACAVQKRSQESIELAQRLTLEQRLRHARAH